MGLFKKKADPISERARALSQQIADLEKQITRLADKIETEPPEAPPPAPLPPPEPAPVQKPPPRSVVPEPHVGGPRLRSTAFPQSQVIVHTPTRDSSEPVFEDVPNNPFKTNGEEAPPEPELDIGVRKGNLSEMWKRIQSQFKNPPASNPKLVSYLAAGSIQGLRPLRYEKRVARNRFIALVVVLGLVIWGLLAVFLRR